MVVEMITGLSQKMHHKKKWSHISVKKIPIYKIYIKK